MRHRVLHVMLPLLSMMPAAADQAQLPDLAPIAPSDVRFADAETVEGRAVRFSVTTQNRGAHALELRSVKRSVGDPTSTVAEQCVEWRGRVCRRYEPVGTMTLHRVHAHWHFSDYALYELRRLLPSGEPDMSAEGLAASGGKASFCLLDTDRTQSARPFPQDPFGMTGYYVTCAEVIQGISAGWADTYGEYLPGQEIPLAGVPAGVYAIVVTIDPDGKLAETDEGNNVSWRTITWSGA